MVVGLKTLRLRAGPQALQLLQQRGCTPDLIHAFGAPAGGPKFLIMAGLDRYLFGDWFTSRQHALPVFGSSIGAYRMAAAAHAQPLKAFERLIESYCAQRYDARPDPVEVTAKVQVLLKNMLDAAEHEQICQQNRLHLHLITTRCLGWSGSEQRLQQQLGLSRAFIRNALQPSRLSAHFERCVFVSAQARQDLLQCNQFTTHKIVLTPDNLAHAVLASGALPLVMENVRNIAHAPSGVYLDGGLVDYHMDLPLALDDGIYLLPHYEDRLVPRWFDKLLSGRMPKHTSKMLLLTPAPEAVAKLPGGRIPNRDDFKRYHGDDAGRLKAWRAALALSQQIAEEFAELIATKKLAAACEPLGA